MHFIQPTHRELAQERMEKIEQLYGEHWQGMAKSRRQEYFAADLLHCFGQEELKKTTAAGFEIFDRHCQEDLKILAVRQAALENSPEPCPRVIRATSAAPGCLVMSTNEAPNQYCPPSVLSLPQNHTRVLIQILTKEEVSVPRYFITNDPQVWFEAPTKNILSAELGGQLLSVFRYTRDLLPEWIWVMLKAVPFTLSVRSVAF